ncbi:basic salivary proline-rich protein 4-like [Elephas maximus indicus]|uniref:basic salivary proline-rich protein 4-like n=1 Tax=Elephas maximus indicus TaxID=99487 RepID=UPI002116CCE8|nr:basic salivary proline-rich protein 4-like [Elephas maximus indicus]
MEDLTGLSVMPGQLPGGKEDLTGQCMMPGRPLARKGRPDRPVDDATAAPGGKGRPDRPVCDARGKTPDCCILPATSRGKGRPDSLSKMPGVRHQTAVSSQQPPGRKGKPDRPVHDARATSREKEDLTGLSMMPGQIPGGKGRRDRPVHDVRGKAPDCCLLPATSRGKGRLDRPFHDARGVRHQSAVSSQQPPGERKDLIGLSMMPGQPPGGKEDLTGLSMMPGQPPGRNGRPDRPVHDASGKAPDCCLLPAALGGKGRPVWPVYHARGVRLQTSVSSQQPPGGKEDLTGLSITPGVRHQTAVSSQQPPGGKRPDRPVHDARATSRGKGRHDWPVHDAGVRHQTAVSS